MTETNEQRCLMAPSCKFAGKQSHCHDHCFPYRKAHGESGNSGIIGLSGIPKKYKTATKHNLPIEKDNPDAYKMIVAICDHIDQFIDEGVGLYLYSVPNTSNPKGTGTGKTTSAITVMNAYLTKRIIQHIKGERQITELPALFVKASKLQNTYNAQFRGTQADQEQASSQFYKLKKLMIETDLLVLDDIALRGATEAFTNELYEVIDERISEERAIILTSNEPIQVVGQVLSEQIQSRIMGSCVLIPFEGKDYRRGNL